MGLVRTRARVLQDPFGLQHAVFETAQPDHAAPRHGTRQSAIGIGCVRNPAHQGDQADGLALMQRGGLLLRQGQRRDVGQRGRDRKQQVRGSRRFIVRFAQFVQGYCVLFQERADAQAPECGDVTDGAAGFRQIAGEAAHVDALAGGDLEHRGVGVRAVDQHEAVDPGGARFQIGARPSRAMS